MKRNILTIVILALSIVNLVLTAVIVFSVVPNVNKTNNLIDQVAQIINLDLEAQNGNEKVITVDDLENYDLDEELVINLKKDSDSSKERYAVVSKISISLYKGVDDFSKVKKNIEASTSNVYDIIRKSFSNYTKDEAKLNEDVIKENIIKMLNEKYGDKVVQDIAFGSLVYQ
ncbi:flagellar basal body-associated FliL family protein [Anaerosporobacter faecicola]|uniref:flagellar basal body-associated FliL family protein n=1 Tax=Anaerosporobacter faecicola TaxID=2718714 RepID=UPI0014395A95|nr:flagellar basal body-associated FliL family protein [Anaerosporobacter faecicola]